MSLQLQRTTSQFLANACLHVAAVATYHVPVFSKRVFACRCSCNVNAHMQRLFTHTFFYFSPEGGVTTRTLFWSGYEDTFLEWLRGHFFAPRVCACTLSHPALCTSWGMGLPQWACDCAMRVCMCVGMCGRVGVMYSRSVHRSVWVGRRQQKCRQCNIVDILLPCPTSA